MRVTTFTIVARAVHAVGVISCLAFDSCEAERDLSSRNPLQDQLGKISAEAYHTRGPWRRRADVIPRQPNRSDDPLDEGNCAVVWFIGPMRTVIHGEHVALNLAWKA